MQAAFHKAFSQSASKGDEPISFLGVAGSKTLAFKIGEKVCFVAHIISGDESAAWRACEEMLAYAVKNAATGVKGFYGLELLSLNLSEGAEGFEARKFSELLTNHAKRLQPGAHAILQYGGFLLRLHKRIPEAWGKIEFKTYVEVFRKSRAELNLFVKKKCSEILKATAYAESPKTLMIVDLSRDSLFRFGEEPQT